MWPLVVEGGDAGGCGVMVFRFSGAVIGNTCVWEGERGRRMIWCFFRAVPR